MKIIELSAFSNFSVGNIMRDISSALIKEGNEVLILSARNFDNSNSGVINYQNKAKIYFMISLNHQINSFHFHFIFHLTIKIEYAHMY